MDQPSSPQQTDNEVWELEFDKLHLLELDKGTNVEENVKTIKSNLDNVAKVEESDEENTDLLEVSGIFEDDDDYVVDKTLRIDLILCEIQKNLRPLSDLLQFRQVCRQWHNYIASTTVIIKQSRERELKFVFQKSINGYSQVGRPDNTLDKFNEVFKNCSQLPFASISIDKGSFTTPDAQEFLSLYGQRITTLRWRIRPSTSSQVTIALEDEDDDFLRRTIGSFRKLLTTDVPNLTQLIIEGTPRQWEYCSYEELFPSPARLPELPNLKMIKLGDESICTPIIREVLTAAKNLERIEGVEIMYLETLMEYAPTKVHAMKDFFFGHFFGESQVEQCLQYANLKPQLEKVVIHYEDTFEDLDFDERLDVGTAISKILRSSQNTLKKIMFCPLSFLPEFEFPILANVEEIYFCDTEAIYADEEIEGFKIMPDGQEVANIFPNVTNVKFNMEAFKETDGLSWRDLFDRHDRLPSCKSLRIGDANSETGRWLKKISRFLPHVENLRIITYNLNEAAPQIFQRIWKHFPNLRTLKLQMRVRPYEDDFSSVMDSAFTGIDKEQCVSLSGESTFEEVNKFRTNPSILDLHELKFLVMEFDVRGAGLWENNVISPIFSVAGPHGFALLKERQNVQIKISTFYPASPEKISGLRSALSSVMKHVDSFESQIEDED